jgi:hypothetical protein
MMSTHSQHHHETAPRFADRAEREARHPLATTVGVIVGAIVVGALVGLLLAAAIEGPATAQIHRGGGHGRAAIHHQMQQVTASAATQSSGEAAVVTSSAVKRSRARGGFPVGRAFDIGGSAAATTSGTGAGSSSQP